MEIEQMKLTRIRINEANPRDIKQDKFRKLVNSLLVFPKMLGVRPVVIDSTFKAIGGNQRTKALIEISKMKIEAIADRLCTIPDFADKTAGEQQALIKWWSDWLDNPCVPTIMADTLSEHEKQQFIIKDNVSYGAWDYDNLANNFDSAQLQSWGMEVWNDAPVASSESESETPDEGGEQEDEFEDAMPPELQGVNLHPDVLEKIQGDDERINDYVVINYEASDLDSLLEFLHIKKENWTGKVCYTLDEIKFMQEG